MNTYLKKQIKIVRTSARSLLSGRWKRKNQTTLW